MCVVRKEYNRLKKLISGDYTLKSYIQSVLKVSTPEDFVAMEEDKLYKVINMVAFSFTNETMLGILRENELIEYDEIAMNNEKEYDNINEAYSEKLKCLIKNYRQSLINEKQMVLKKQQDYDTKIINSENKIEEMIEQLSKLRFFERRKKKELQYELDMEQQKREELKKEKRKIGFDWL